MSKRETEEHEKSDDFPFPKMQALLDGFPGEAELAAIGAFLVLFWCFYSKIYLWIQRKTMAAEAKVIKFNVGSHTDQALGRMQKRLGASSSVEAMRRSLAIADKITEFTSGGQKVFVKDQNGLLREILIT